jgi:hypothetical protein
VKECLTPTAFGLAHPRPDPEYIEEIGDDMMGNHAVFGDNELYKAHFRRAHVKAYDKKCLKYLHGLVANVDEGVDVKREVLSSFIKTIAGNTQ